MMLRLKPIETPEKELRRRVLEARYVIGLSIRKAALHVGVTVGTVSGILWRERHGSYYMSEQSGPRDWTAEEWETLCRLKGEGASWDDIAKVLGRNKAGVESKWRRARRGEKLKPHKPAPKPKKVKQVRPEPSFPASGRCCWPLWDHQARPTYKWCGAPVDGPLPYCRIHAEMAYYKAAS